MDSTMDIGRLMSQVMSSKYTELPPRKIRFEQYPEFLKTREHVALTPAERYTQCIIWCLSLKISEYERLVLNERRISTITETVLNVLKQLRYMIIFGQCTLGTPPFDSPIALKLHSKKSHPEDARNQQTLALLARGKQNITIFNNTKRTVLSRFYMDMNTIEELKKKTEENANMSSQSFKDLISKDGAEIDANIRTVDSLMNKTNAILKHLVFTVRDVELETNVSFNQACSRIEKYKRKLS